MNKILHFSIILLLIIPTILSFGPTAWAQEGASQYELEMDRRLNAHGNEFMCLALTSDAKRLIIGTESGAILVWGIAERRIVKELGQGSPVHAVATLKDPNSFITAGGPHTGPNQKGFVLKWNISAGTFEELIGPNASTFLQLSADPATGFVAAGAGDGTLALWDTETKRLQSTVKFDGVIVGLGLSGQDLYVTGLDPDMESEDKAQNAIWKYSKDKLQSQPSKLMSESAKRVWGDLQISPDGRFIAAQYRSDVKEEVALIEISTRRKLAQLDASSAAWSANGSLVLFDRQVPIRRLNLGANGKVTQSALLKGGAWHGSGQPTGMTGRVISPDGSKAWEVFQINSAFGEIDLNKKAVEPLISLHGSVYAIDVNEQGALIATGGDDEFVRVRRLADLTLVKEFHAKPGVPQGVALMENGLQVIFSASGRNTPSLIYSGDLNTGATKVLLEIDEPFIKVVRAQGGFIYNRSNKLILASPEGTTVREFHLSPTRETIARAQSSADKRDLTVDQSASNRHHSLQTTETVEQFTVSANGEWLAVSNEKGKIYCFEVRTSKQTFVGTRLFESLTRLTISNDGRFVYATEFQTGIRRLDTKSDTITDVTEIRGQARTLVLSSDEKWIAVGGNHHDVAVYDVNNGEKILSLEVGAADFYVTNVWLNQKRLIFTTDAGVLFDGRFIRAQH